MRGFIRGLMFILGIAALLGSRAVAAPPNIVFVLADDLGWRDLGCYGSTFYETPNLDRLAAQGMRFTDAYAGCSVCSPTRASIMTGMYPARLGITDWMPGRGDRPDQKMKRPALPKQLPLEEVTIAEALKEGGYRTGFIGKWHLGGPGFFPEQQGFDINLGGCDLGGPPSYFPPYKIVNLPDGPKGEYLTDRLTDEAVKFIEASKDKPFFLYLSHYTVHNPQQAKAELIEKYKAKAAQLPPPAGPEFLPEGKNQTRQIQNKPIYAAMIQSMDESMGRIMKKLEELGLDQNTIIVFTSDNGGLSTSEGQPTSNVPLRAGKGWHYEGGVREPLIVRGPVVTKPGSICRDPMISTDYYPTLLELAGLPLRPAQHMDGVSVVPLLKGNVMPERPLFWHYPHYSNQGGGPGGAIRLGNFKLIEWYEDMRIELFNIAEDIGEKNDLAAKMPEKAAALREQLHQWRTSVDAKMPTPNPEYKPKADAAPAGTKPNIIFVLSDDLAQGDIGCYGQKLIKTPNLDRMAAQGTRFTQAYCGTTVCAPSRTSLMTGLHMGHSPIRANREIPPEGQLPLPADTFTVAQLLKSEGYATACMGKWGMGMFDTTGSPLKKGFDHFFGYNCQRTAHSYFPSYLYNDSERFGLPWNDGKGIGRTYAQNLIADETLKWVRDQKDRPFFLFYAITLPHARYEIDDVGQYADRPWTKQQQSYAAMVSRLDSDVGRLLSLLKELNIDEKTLVIVAGDNGSSFAPKSELGKLFEQAANGLRGYKRELYEGGLRQAAIARWPGNIPAGRVSDDPWAFWDFLPTAAELSAAKLPEGFKPDGYSLVSFLKGGPAPQREYFYWELHEGRPQQAIRFGDWKAVRTGPSKALELYDLKADPGEKNDLAVDKPDVIARAESLIKSARVDNVNFPWKEPAPKKAQGAKPDTK